MSKKNKDRRQLFFGNAFKAGQSKASAVSQPSGKPDFTVPHVRDLARIGGDGAPYEVKNLLSSQLNISAVYQRKVDQARVRRIVAEFDPKLVNMPKVSLRDGAYYVFDGAHTLTALRQMANGQDFKVTCRVYLGLSLEDEATLFSQQMGLSKQVSIPEKLRALEIGGDPETIEFLESTRYAGFTITPGENHRRKGHILAVAKALEAYRKLGSEQYVRMLELIKASWHGDPQSVSQNMLGAMVLVIQTYGDEIINERFNRRMQAAPYETIHSEALKFPALSPAYAHAMSIVKAYNRPGGHGVLDATRLSLRQIEQG